MKPRFPRPKDQAALRRKAAIVQDRILADSRKKTKQAERMLGDAASVSSRAKKKGREAHLEPCFHLKELYKCLFIKLK